MNFVGALNWSSYFKEKREYIQKEEDKKNNIKTF